MSEQGSTTGAGCGLAAYAIVLLGICLIGLVGIVLSTVNLLSMEAESLSQLVHGSEVPVWRLQPMRDAGVLELTEVPLAWHDESPERDGSTVCALRASSVVRVHGGEAQELDFLEIQDVSAEVSQDTVATVTVTGGAAPLLCHFGPGEGAERFVRQLEQERRGPQSG